MRTILAALAVALFPLPASAGPAKTTVATIAGFRAGETYVHTDDRVKLRELATLWKAMPERAQLVVEGNGLVAVDEEASIALGQRRADRVRDWLVKFGVDPSCVVAVGNSRERPGNYVAVMVETR